MELLSLREFVFYLLRPKARAFDYCYMIIDHYSVVAVIFVYGCLKYASTPIYVMSSCAIGSASMLIFMIVQNIGSDSVMTRREIKCAGTK